MNKKKAALCAGILWLALAGAALALVFAYGNAFIFATYGLLLGICLYVAIDKFYKWLIKPDKQKKDERTGVM